MTGNVRLVVALLCLAISSVGDDMHAMAIIFKLRVISQDPFLLPLVFSVQLGCGALAFRLVSSFPERFGVKRVAAISSVILSVLSLTYPFLDSPVQLIAAVSVFSFVSAALNTSVFVLIPAAAEAFGYDASKGNALAEGLNSGSAVVGPPLCGFIVIGGYLDLAFVVNAATFSILVVGLAILGPITVSQGTHRKALLSAKPQRPNLTFLMVGLGAVAFSTAVSDVVFVLLVEDNFNGSALVYGGSTAAWSLGLIFATIWAMKRSSLGLRTTFVGATGMGVSLFIVAAIGWISYTAAVALLGFLFLAGGFFNGLHNISVRNFITSSFQLGQRGTVYGMYGAYIRIGVLSGYWIGSLLAAEAVLLSYAASGALAFLVGITGVFFLGLRSTGPGADRLATGPPYMKGTDD